MKKALLILSALSIIHYPLSIVAGTNAFVTINTNTGQLSNLGFSSGGQGLLWSNSVTGAWGQIPTNSHFHVSDEYGATYDFHTNGTLDISNYNGNRVTITNGNIMASGTISASVLAGNAATATLSSNVVAGLTTTNEIATNLVASNSLTIASTGTLATLTLVGNGSGGTSQTIQSSPGGLAVGSGQFTSYGGGTLFIANVNSTGTNNAGVVQENGNAVVTNGEAAPTSFANTVTISSNLQYSGVPVSSSNNCVPTFATNSGMVGTSVFSLNGSDGEGTIYTHATSYASGLSSPIGTVTFAQPRADTNFNVYIFPQNMTASWSAFSGWWVGNKTTNGFQFGLNSTLTGVPGVTWEYHVSSWTSP